MKKKHKIVMLPTTEASHLYRYRGGLVFTEEYEIAPIGGNYHLYAISDEQINLHDWYIDDIDRVRQSVVANEGEGDVYWKARSEYKKICATSDKSLTIKTSREEKIVESGVYEKPLPQLPQSLIKSYAEQPFDEVMLEYETKGEWVDSDVQGHVECVTCGGWTEQPIHRLNCECGLELKLNSDNTVIWSESIIDKIMNSITVEEELEVTKQMLKELSKEKTYSKEEVERFVRKIYVTGCWIGREIRKPYDDRKEFDLEKWIKENLK